MNVGDFVRIARSSAKQFQPMAMTRTGVVRRIRADGLVVVKWEGLSNMQTLAQSHLEKIQSRRNDPPRRPGMPGPHSTTEEIEAFIAECSERLKGPMDNVERAWTVADRREARDEIARRARAKLTRAELAALGLKL